MIKRLPFALLLLLFINSAFAQITSCGFDFIRTSDPALMQKEENANQLLYQKTISESGEKGHFRTLITIPVVVHIIHQNGAENLSDSVVIAGINQMNLRFQNAAPYYDSTGTAVNIQFCLSSIDPQGNTTGGITRDFSPLTYLWASNDLQMKNINRWDPYYYYNIWVVNSIYGFNMSVSGYSSLPSNTGDGTDGVVLQYSAFTTEVLTHETGHYLGLYHTWQGGCNNSNCLLEGDEVCDTPPDTSTSLCMGNSCATEMDDTSGFNPFLFDVNDLPNYMDYTPCPLSFTPGQAERMNNALTAIRTLLLQSSGCGFSGGPPPEADLGYFISGCNDGVVNFSDSLSTLVNTVNWDFNNDGLYDSYNHNPVFTFPATGTYTVKLIVTGPGGVDSAFQTLFVQKAPSLYYPITTMGGVFTNQNGELASCANFQNNLSSAPALSYAWSTGDTTQNISFTPDSTYSIYLTIVDSAGLTWSNQVCHPLVVRVETLPPTAAIYSNDPLNICDGDTVILHSGLNPDESLTLNWYQNSQITGTHDTVFTAVGFSPGIPYQLIIADTNGCYSWSNILYVNSYAPPITQSLTQNGLQLTTGWGGGNQWYIDGVAIPGANGPTWTVTQIGCYSVEWFFSFAPNCTRMSDSICFLTVDANALLPEEHSLIIFPVPSENYFRINAGPEFCGSEYKLTDPSGRVVLTGEISTENAVVGVSHLANGVYFLNLFLKNECIVRKIMKE